MKWWEGPAKISAWHASVQWLETSFLPFWLGLLFLTQLWKRRLMLFLQYQM